MTNNSQNDLPILERILNKTFELISESGNFNEEILSNMRQLKDDGNLINPDLIEVVIMENSED